MRQRYIRRPSLGQNTAAKRLRSNTGLSGVASIVSPVLGVLNERKRAAAEKAKEKGDQILQAWMTGGDSFAYVMFRLGDTQDTVRRFGLKDDDAPKMWLVPQGRYPLYNVTVQISPGDLFPKIPEEIEATPGPDDFHFPEIYKSAMLLKLREHWPLPLPETGDEPPSPSGSVPATGGSQSGLSYGVSPGANGGRAGGRQFLSSTRRTT
jgi:hypothetical protein